MNAKTSTPASKVAVNLGTFDHTVLVLQGGGALGAYQAGVYAGLAEVGVAPDWIAGVSIGAINAALIAGNPPERGVERLREFWERMSAQASFMPPASLDPMRPLFNFLSAASAVTFGVPGFFAPRMPPPFMVADGSMAALSYYDTKPLRTTLEELVDFDRINRKEVRLSLGAVSVRSGNSVYFDNWKMRIGPEHVLASGALPPGFPPVEVDGELYWDGGIASNTPLWYVADEDYRMSALILQVDVFSGAGELPQNLHQVAERAKDIQYASKTRFNSTRIKELEELRASLRRVLDKLPPAIQSDADVQRLTAASTRGAVALVHFINRHNTRSCDFKDYEFSRATVTELWEGGHSDVRCSIAHPQWRNAMELAHGIHVYDLTPLNPTQQEPKI
ncbi:patatin-like phospholipase family protein [Paraburkholderia hospita]|jgi:NTE family protein|uniref:patatin-like phospholipase family protein n=1 Tax=Paraburkholderia hospita TaxID=169430 RepID=UPI0009A7D3F9|nr:patatin-like phospholipase family protein [Paraburkholderia hospita]